MQDNWQNGIGEPSSPHLFYWPGEDQIAGDIGNWLDADCTPFNAMGLSAALRDGRGAIVLWCGPESHLAACLARGHGVAPALESWKTAARGLLVLFRKNRRKIVLANAAGLGRGGLDDLARHLGRTAPDAALTDVATPALAKVLAGLAQHQDADLHQLTLELQTASLPCPELPLSEVMEFVTAEAAATAQAAVDFSQTAARMEAEIATLSASLAVAETSLRDAEAARFEAVAQIELMQSQIELVQDVMTRQQDRGHVSLEATSLLVDTNKALLATQTSANELLNTRIDAQNLEIARLTAALEQEVSAKAEVVARLAAQGADLDLLRTQIGLTDGSLARVDSQAQTANEVASLRVQALEAQLATQKQAAAEAERQLGLQQQEAARLGATVTAQGQTIAELQDRLATAAAVTDSEGELLRTQLGLLQELLAQGTFATSAALPAEAGADSEVDLMRTQLGLSQELVAQGTFATAAALPADSGTDPAPRTEAWDKALAKALASARFESEQRARLERDLSILRAEMQTRVRREEDLTHNRKLFTMMTTEANAALDEIARLSKMTTSVGSARKAAGA